MIRVNVDEIRMKKYDHTLEIYNRLCETLQSIVCSHPKEYVRCKTLYNVDTVGTLLD